MQFEPTTRPETGDEESAALGVDEEFTCVGPAGQGAGEQRIDPRNHRGGAENVDGRRLLVDEDLVQDVVLHEQVSRLVGCLDVGTSSGGSRGESRQLQAGRPPVGPLDDGVDPFLGEGR